MTLHTLKTHFYSLSYWNACSCTWDHRSPEMGLLPLFSLVLNLRLVCTLKNRFLSAVLQKADREDERERS